MPEQVSQSNPQRESYPRRLLRWIQTGWRTFNSAYDATGRAAKFLWQNKKRIGVAGTVIAGGITALGLAYSKAAQSNLIFNGPIDDAIVRYEEGQGILFENNVMTIRKNGYVYTFTDSSGEHNIDWQNNDPNFGDDLLEEIVIRDSIGRVKRISRKNVNNKGNIESDVATISYDFANQLYNSTRGKIREFLRQDYSSECEGMKKNLSELQKQDR